MLACELQQKVTTQYPCLFCIQCSGYSVRHTARRPASKAALLLNQHVLRPNGWYCCRRWRVCWGCLGRGWARTLRRQLPRWRQWPRTCLWAPWLPARRASRRPPTRATSCSPSAAPTASPRPSPWVRAAQAAQYPLAMCQQRSCRGAPPICGLCTPLQAAHRSDLFTLELSGCQDGRQVH